MSTGTIEPATDRAAWLERRRRGIGASEIAAVMGLSPFATPLDVYASKLGLTPDQPETMPMRIGTALEPTLKRLYEEETGHAVPWTQVEMESAYHPFLIATLDGVRDDNRVIEFKSAGSGRARELGEDGSDELPDHWILQGHHQLMVHDSDTMDFAVLTGGRSLDFRIFTVRRDERVCAAILEAARAFWDMVLSRNPPPISAPSDVRHLPRLGLSGESVALDEVAGLDWLRYEDFGREIAGLQKQRAAIRARLHAALGTAAIGVLPDGSRLVRKIVTRKSYVAAESSYAALTHQKGD
jgi:putative phage-type endonuclease